MYIMTWKTSEFIGPFKSEAAANAWAKRKKLLAYTLLTNLPTYARSRLQFPHVEKAKAYVGPLPQRLATLRQWRERNAATQHTNVLCS